MCLKVTSGESSKIIENMSNQDRPTIEDILPQSDYPVSQQDLVCQPDSDLSNYSPANNFTGKAAFITGEDFW